MNRGARRNKTGIAHQLLSCGFFGVFFVELKKKREVASGPGWGYVDSDVVEAGPEVGGVDSGGAIEGRCAAPGVSKASPLEALVRGIVYQRMAGKAAGTIYERGLRDEVGRAV